MSTPAGTFIFKIASTAFAFGANTSINLKCVLDSNCSLESLYLCVARMIVTTSLFVGSGIGPETLHPDFVAVSRILETT